MELIEDKLLKQEKYVRWSAIAYVLTDKHAIEDRVKS